MAEARNGRICQIYNNRSSLVLEIGGGNPYYYQDDQPANQYYNYGTQNQQWRIQYVSANRGTALSTASAAPTEMMLGLYPNPVQTTLTLSLPKAAKITTVQVSDMKGATMATARYGDNGQLNVADLAPGLYVVTVFDGQREYRQKFVKE